MKETEAMRNKLYSKGAETATETVLPILVSMDFISGSTNENLRGGLLHLFIGSVVNRLD